jgi:predicted O-methyltransferase YrrM
MTATAPQPEARTDCDTIYGLRPAWVEGFISLADARYLHERLTQDHEGAVVEIGTASGVSTAIMRFSLDPSEQLYTYDISPQFYAAPERRTGEAAETMLPDDLVKRISFRSPAMAPDLAVDHGANAIGFLFLDASHKHPWPTLDLLAVLDQLRSGAEVVLHDVNLPLHNPQHQLWGAKYLFDGLDVVKQLAPEDDDVPNIGSCFVPADKQQLRDQLLRILYAHEWECEIDPQTVARFLARDALDFKAFLRKAVPTGSNVLVVSKGDTKLLEVLGLAAGHFPQREDGVYAGYYPKTSAAAIEHLEALREQGAEFIAFPPAACWWLDHYAEFADHLRTKHHLIARDEKIGAFYALDRSMARSVPRPTARRVPSTPLTGILDDDLVDDVKTLFDPAHYVAQAGRPAGQGEAALAHYLTDGYRQGFTPHPLFDARWYKRRYRVEGNPLLHYVSHGAAHPLDPNPCFDSEYYAGQVEERDGLRQLPLVHYVQRAADNESYHPNPLLRDGFYLRTYEDLPAGQTPLQHWLQTGWREGRFVSELHRDMVEQLARSSRSGLVRGNWKQGAVLFFTAPFRAGGPDMVAVADELADRLHLDALIVAGTRADLAARLPASARLLVLEDFQLAADVKRPSAQRLLAQSIAASQPLFAVAGTTEVLYILTDLGVGTYVLMPDANELHDRRALSDVVDLATRLVVPSSAAFHAFAEALAEPPPRVALRRPDRKDYADSLVALAERDFDIELAASVTRATLATEPPRRIVIPCSDWTVSGVNSSLEGLGHELMRRGWDVEILFTRDQGWVTDSAGGGSHMPTLPYRWLRRPRVGIEGLWEALISDLESSGPVLMMSSYDFLANSTIPALSNRVGVVMWVQADDGDYYEQAYRLGRYCDAIVCVSQNLREKVVGLNPGLADRTHVVPNSSIRERDIAGRRSRGGDILRIVYAGRLVQYQKRVLDYVELARRLDLTGLPYEITLIGTFSKHGDDGDTFHRLAAAHLDNGRIRLAGRRSHEEILTHLDESDLFVLLSEFEGLPLALVEAMARGCVPVAAEMESGVPEIINSGENGLIVPGRDYDEWARQIAQLGADRRRLGRMSRKARATVRRDLTVEQAASRFEELLKRAAADAAAGTARRPPALHWGAERSTTGDVLPPPSLVRPAAVQVGGLRRWR